MQKRSITSVTAAFLMVVFSVLPITAATARPAGAFVLEGPHVLDLTAKAMGKIAALQVDQKLLIYPQEPETVATVFDETATYVMPQRFRSDIDSDQVRRTHLVFADSSLTVIDGRMTIGEAPFDRYQRLLRSRTRPQLMRTLNRLGVETAISSLGRVGKTVVFVLGAHYPDESVSQLAVDQETFLPVRLLMVDNGLEATGQRLEIVYRNWQKVKKAWFPLEVLFYTNGRLAREIRVVDRRPNPSIPPTMMDLEVLKASVAHDNADTPQRQKQEAVKEVQRAVQDFQKKFE